MVPSSIIAPPSETFGSVASSSPDTRALHHLQAGPHGDRLVIHFRRLGELGKSDVLGAADIRDTPIQGAVLAGGYQIVERLIGAVRADSDECRIVHGARNADDCPSIFMSDLPCAIV